ncbi:MAG TPA: OmpA family protein [Candidatus Sulfotelmatobacter sp.]|jgi:outer membrane protein OmpA-like peptidoglycan-associated protein
MKVSSIERRMRPFLTGISALIAIVAISTPAVAQSDSTPKWDVFAGYQYTDPGGTVPLGPDPNNPTPFKLPGMAKGIGGAFTYNFDSHWGLETDAGYSRDTGSASSEWTIGAGPRFIWRTEDVAFFLHGLATFNRVTYNAGFNTSNGVGAIAGGGMDIPFGKMFSWRVFGADYVFAAHNFSGFASPAFPNLRHPNFEGVRLRTGVVLSWGGAAPPVPAAACTVQPAEVMVGEPISATVTASNFNPKHTVTYSWSGTGGAVTGKDTAATIDTNNATPGSYVLTAHVTDPKANKNNEASCTANYTIKPLPPKNPPTMSLSASPTDLVPGGSVNLTATCTSPDGAQVSVANWTSSAGNVSGSGNSTTLSTAGLPAGAVTVTATCTDARGLTAQASTQITLENPPPPPVDKALEARLALHSVYFPTAMPPAKDPSAGLLPSQRKILDALAVDYKKYLENKPDTHLVLEGHADIRGTAAFNQALSERRVARVKSYLVEQGIPDADIETKAFGFQKNLTLEEVKTSIESRSDLTTEERKRALARIQVIKLASNRRVDITLNTPGQSETSVKQFPFNAADALSLIGGRESEKAAKPAPKKKPMKKR